MTIESVSNKKKEKVFLDLPKHLYKNHKYWIPPLYKDIKSVFDNTKNPIAQKDYYKRWVLFDNNQKAIGRIAAFINKKTMTKNNDYLVGGIGFFDCVDDQKAANLLFDTAKYWLKKNGMEAMEGPINFGERDKFWGLLTNGFDREPNYLANYNFPYYQNLFENYGFLLYFNQFTISRDTAIKLSSENLKNAQVVLNDSNYKFKSIKKKNLDKYTEDFRIIYNKAWAKHLGVTEMKVTQAKRIINSLKPVLDEKLAWFGYYKDKPISFFISIPEMNQVFKHVNGKLNLYGKLVFLFYKWFNLNTKMLGIVFGVIPEYDGKGVTHAMIYTTQKMVLSKTNYKYLEMHGIGDFNPAMLNFVNKMGNVTKSKTHTTYRYLFDRNMEFQRMPIKKHK